MIFGQIFKQFLSLSNLTKSQPELGIKKLSSTQVHFFEVLFKWPFFLLVATQLLPSEKPLLAEQTTVGFLGGGVVGGESTCRVYLM